jgi:hypothetical protein
MRLKLLVLLLSFAGVLYWQDSTSDDAMDKYIADYKKFQAQADSATKFADSLAQEIIIADNEARAAQSRASVYSRQATELKNETLNLMDRAQLLTETITDTLQLARQILPLKDSIITKQETTITTQGNQIQELETAILKKDDALKLALLRGDSLQTVVNNIPPAPKNPNKMFGIKLPSRKTSFVVGVVAGVVIGGVVLKRLH